MSGIIAVLTDDLMIGSRVAATLEAAGYAVRIVGTAEATRGIVGVHAVLLPFAAPGFDAPAAIRALRTDAHTAHLPVLAFGPHVDAAGQAAATAAGATRVITNGLFFTKMGYVVGQLLAERGEHPAG